MIKTNKLTADRRNGNLHIDIMGEYTEQTVHDLMSCMSTMSTGSGNIFIHTTKITVIQQCSNCINEEMMVEAQLCPENIYLIGKYGLSLNIPCNKVIIPPAKKARCSGCKKKNSKKGLFHES